jgi:signal transduction histidine kinase
MLEIKRFHSMRWRLSVSYAGIACIATLVLGAVLLATLRGHYAEQERRYLHRNARAFASVITAQPENISTDELLGQLRLLAFFSQTRIVYTSTEDEVIADTEAPEDNHIINITLKNIAAQNWRDADFRPAFQTLETDQGTSFVYIYPGENASPIEIGRIDAQTLSLEPPDYEDGPSPPQRVEGEGEENIIIESGPILPLARSFYGFDMGRGIEERREAPRSDQTVSQTVLDREGNPVGTLTLSEGPAYGMDIVNSVAEGWLIAGSVAIALAAAVGWTVSLRMTRPVLALTRTTAKMAEGDLSARADYAQKDEFGMLAASFNEMADRIESTITALRRFVADAAHEIHTPLTALRTNLELADAFEHDPAVKCAHDQVERLQSLAEGLLDLSKIESHALPQEYGPVDLAALVRERSEIYASRAEQADLAFMLNLEDDLPPVKGNVARLGQLICNLLDNAIKFTPPGGEVALRLKAESSDKIALTVEDTGIGIPEDDLPYLFERFRRAHNAAAYPGSGLGLAIVKAIAESHGGSVRAESGRSGTVITVTFSPNL